jgi:rhamnosyltransferase subunit B
LKAILTPVGSDGDVLPFVGTGVELARRGYDVVVIANDHFEPIVRHAGLQFAACGTSEQYRRLIFGRGVIEIRRAAREILESVSRDLHRVVAAHYSPGETVLVAHVLAWGARIVQELHAAPLATLALSPAALFSAREPPVHARLLAARAQGWLNRGIGWLMHAIVEHEAGRIVNPYRASLGLSPERLIQPRGHLVAMFPEWFGPKAPDWPGDLVLAGFPLQETGARDQDRGVEDFLLEGSAPIVFTSGTGLVHVRPVFDAAIDACQRLGRRGILLTRYLDQVPDRLPESVRHFAYVDLGTLLPRAVALVHHGGIGTSARGLAAGVPHVIVPYGFDQFDNMARLEGLGVAASTPWRGVTGRALAGKLRPLIETPSVTARARALAERLRGTNGIGVACDAIERWAPRACRC